MSNRAIVAYYLVAALLGLNLWWSAGARLATSPANEAPRLEPLMALDPAAVERVGLRSGEQRVVLERSVGGHERWRVIEPSGGVIAGDLVDALLDALSSLPPVQLVSSDPSTAERFGLKPPRTVIALEASGDAAETIYLGQRNPTRTAVYAAKPGGPLYLIGLNAQYYADLIFEQVRRASGA